MVLPIAENFPIQFPPGAGNTQSSVDIAVSSTQGFAYVIGKTPTTGTTSLQNFVFNIETGELVDTDNRSSQVEGALPVDTPEAVTVLDDGRAETNDVVYMLGSTEGDLLQSDEEINQGGKDYFILQYRPDENGTLVPTDEDGNQVLPTIFQGGGEGDDTILDATGDTQGNLAADGTDDGTGDNNSDVWVAEITQGSIFNTVVSEFETETDEFAKGIGTTQGDIYITGNTDGFFENVRDSDDDPEANLGGQDSFIAKYSGSNFSATSEPLFVEQSLSLPLKTPMEHLVMAMKGKPPLATSRSSSVS
ncbi:UNVERIFIED_CONTAM: hypothetical protein BEN50_19050 [Euhalothece sp. KZN 001]